MKQILLDLTLGFGPMFIAMAIYLRVEYLPLKRANKLRRFFW